MEGSFIGVYALITHKTIIKALWLSLGLFLNVAYAQEVIDNQKAVETEPAILERWQDGYFSDYIVGLINTQSQFGGYVQSFGETIDDFFGDESIQTTKKGSRLTLYSPLVFYGDGSIQQRLNFSAQLDLPKTNHRWKLVFVNWQDDDLAQTQSTSEKTIEGNNQAQFGARYLLGKDAFGFSHIETGLKFEEIIDPNPYIKYLKRYKYDFSESILSRTTHRLYLERYAGFAWEGQQVFDIRLNQTQLTRSQTSLTWWQQDKVLLLNQKGLLFEKDSANTASAYYVDIDYLLGENRHGLESVAVGVNWRSRLYKDWLFAEIEPQVSLTSEDDFNEPNYSLTLLLEMHFYGQK